MTRQSGDLPTPVTERAGRGCPGRLSMSLAIFGMLLRLALWGGVTIIAVLTRILRSLPTTDRRYSRHEFFTPRACRC